MGSSECVVLPYPRHFGMSRVLLEAASTGTPVVASAFAQLGHLVKAFGLGLAVDTSRPSAFAGAIDLVTGVPGTYDPKRLRLFASRYDREIFGGIVRSELGVDLHPISAVAA